MALIEYLKTAKRKYPDFCVKSMFSFRKNNIYAFFLFSPKLLELLSENDRPVERLKLFYDSENPNRLIFRGTQDPKNSFKVVKTEGAIFSRIGFKWNLAKPPAEARKVTYYEPQIVEDGVEVIINI